MAWNYFIYFAVISIILWLSASVLILNKNKIKLAEILFISGIIVFAGFIAFLWKDLSRPIFKTMGETRLWYSLFLTIIGYITYKKWKYKWLVSYTGVVASVFAIINILKPDIHTQNLMPALQSVWFIPHVSVYIISYSMFGAATIASFIILYHLSKNYENKIVELVDNLVYSGFGFLLLGMLMGAIWAKEAWGNYWSWDPKETWAFLTATAYLVFIHLRIKYKDKAFIYWILIISFILLCITWLGVSYLPSAQSSIHVY